MQDVHGFIEEYPTGGNWYISTRFKELLEQFKIAKDYHFYPTKLLYKGEKLDYWIFQKGGNSMQNIDFTKSVFYIENELKMVDDIYDWDSFSIIRRKYRKEFDKQLDLKRIVFKENLDFIYNIVAGDNLASESLKQAIETAGLEGFEFSEIDYEIGIG